MTLRQSSKRSGKLAGAIFAACAIGGCSGGGSGDAAVAGGNSGALTLKLVDAPVTDVSELWLEITNVSLKPHGNGAAMDFPLDPPLEIDLLTLKTPDAAATLLDGVTVPAGEYDWLAMDVNAAFDGTVDDAHVLSAAGGMEELQVPSGRVRLVSGLTITADQTTSFLVDWDARRGLVRPPGQPGFMLRPAFRVVDMTQYGTLTGTVAAAKAEDASCLADDGDDLGVGNAIYVFAGAGITPDDIDGIDPDPVATIEVGQNGTDYVFRTLLSPGSYTLAFTCQAGMDDPATDDADSDASTPEKVVFSVTADLTIADGEEQSAAL
jgi:hypothetical protein